MKKKTHCKHGHEFSPSNVYISPKTGSRNCKRCRLKSIKLHSDKKLFSGNRELAIERDGEKCVRCGMTRDEHRRVYGCDITVDHIDGRGCKHVVAEKNNSLDNLQTLCIKCHASKDNKARKVTPMQEKEIWHMKGTMTMRDIAPLYGITPERVGQIIKKLKENNPNGN